MLTGPRDPGQGGALLEDTAQVRRQSEEHLIGGLHRHSPHPTGVHHHPFGWGNEQRHQRSTLHRPHPTRRKPKQLHREPAPPAAPRRARPPEPRCRPHPSPPPPQLPVGVPPRRETEPPRPPPRAHNP